MSEFEQLIAVLERQNELLGRQVDLLEQLEADIDDVLETTRSLLGIALSSDTTISPAG